MTHWEYRVLKSEKPMEDQLNALGAEGWELVSVTSAREHIPIQYFGEEAREADFQIAYFKRVIAA